MEIFHALSHRILGSWTEAGSWQSSPAVVGDLGDLDVTREAGKCLQLGVGNCPILGILDITLS